MPRTKRLPRQIDAGERAEPRVNEPKASRPRMPKDYGIVKAKNGKGLLPWGHVGERMARARNYWVSTTRPDGRPHVMPVWGVWVDEAFYFGTDRRSRKARNIASNPAMAVHLESGDEVVIVEGRAEEVAGGPALSQVDKAYAEKYGMGLSGHPADVVLYSLRPRVAFAWREQDFNKSATRWTFDDL
jgi:hypothetical protein